MSIEIHPIYEKFFSNSYDLENQKDWKELYTHPNSTNILNTGKIDFAVNNIAANTLIETAARIALIVVKLIFFPWALYEIHKFLIERLIMFSVLPAQEFSVERVDEIRNRILTNNASDPVILRHINLQKNGITYSGMLVSLTKNISNRKWALHAVGNAIPIEQAIPSDIQYLLATDYNVLLINEPGVGRSEGWATPENMGNSQEIGISYLETAIKAKKIVLSGFSLGGAAIGQAILQHNFKEDVEYIVLRCMTFDSLSHLARIYWGPLGAVVIQWLNYDLDNVAASRKLQELKIPEVIMQAEQDEIIGDASLLNALHKQKITAGKTFFIIPDASHGQVSDPLLRRILYNKETKEIGWCNKLPGIGPLVSKIADKVGNVVWA